MITKEIERIILESKTIAVVGASSNPDKAANQVPQYLKDNGFKIVPINPYSSDILGERTFLNLSELDIEVDIIEIFRPAIETPLIVEEAVKLQPKLIWLQLGIVSEEAKQIAEEYNIPFVMNHCLKVEHMKLTGNY